MTGVMPPRRSLTWVSCVAWKYAAAILAAMLLVISSTAPPAHAACAWVLWNEVTFISSGAGASGNAHQVMLAAFPDFERCERALTAKAADLNRVSEADRMGPNVARVTVEVSGNMVVKTTHLKDGELRGTVYKLNCSPDTIDPRGPKGGTR